MVRTIEFFAIASWLVSQVAVATAGAGNPIPCLHGSHLRLNGPPTSGWAGGHALLSDASFQNATAMTIDVSVWVEQVTFARICSKGDGQGFETDRAYDVTVLGNGILEVNFFLDGPAGPSWVSLLAQNPIAPSAWRRITTSFDSTFGEARLYVDGIIQAITNIDNAGQPLAGQAIRQSSMPLTFGSTQGFPTTTLCGAIDDARIWDRALSATEVAGIGVGQSAPENGMTVYLPFDGHGQNLVGFQYAYFYGTTSLEGDCANVANYGVAVGGTAGPPALTMSAKPLSNSIVQLQISNPSGGASVALLVLGVAPTKIPAFAGHLFVQPLTTSLIGIAGPGVSIPALVPKENELAGVAVFLQAFIPTPSAPAGVSISRGLALEIGKP